MRARRRDARARVRGSILEGLGRDGFMGCGVEVVAAVMRGWKKSGKGQLV